MELLYPQDTVSALTQHHHKQYYEGSEIMVAGRIADHKLSSFKGDVRAYRVNSERWRVGKLGSTQKLQIHTAPHPVPPGASLSPE